MHGGRCRHAPGGNTEGSGGADGVADGVADGGMPTAFKKRPTGRILEGSDLAEGRANDSEKDTGSGGAELKFAGHSGVECGPATGALVVSSAGYRIR